MADVEVLRKHADTLFARDGGLHPPSSVIASWPRPNYVDPETRGWAGPIILIIFGALTTAIYIARMWARLFVSKNAGLDDILMSISMIPLLGLTVSAVLGITVYGYQWHAWDQTPKTLVTSREIALAIELTYMVSTSLIKISILAFYRRITNGSISKTFLYLVWAFMASVVVYCIVFLFTFVFTCSPVEGYWRMFDVKWRLTNKLKCHDEGITIVAAVIVSTISDFLICMLPIFLVWNLQISKRQKAALIGIFGMGIVTCVCGVMRTYYAIAVYYYSYDITWVAFHGWIWTALEADLAVICASAPALKVFFRRYLNLSTNRSRYGYGYSNSRGRKTPTFGSGFGNASQANSGSASQVESGRWDPQPVPLDRIKISRGMNITIQERRNSDSSTRNLTALPSPPLAATGQATMWVEGCRTVCAALKPDSRGSSRERDQGKEIERGS